MSDNPTLKKLTVTASKWSVLSEIAAKAATSLFFVVLARLLAPEDFGVVAVAMIVVSFAQTLWEFGLARSLIQRQTDTEDAADIAFWTNLLLGLVFYIGLAVVADAFANLFGAPKAGPVLRLLGIQIVIGSMSSVHIALYQRDLNFKALFWIRLGTSFLPGAVSIPLAATGFGYWALVAGMIASNLTLFALVWVFHSWRPRWRYNKQLAKDIFKFSFWTTAEGILSWGIQWIDVIIVGAFFSSQIMGMYRFGSMLVAMIFGLVFLPLLPVLFSGLSRIQDDEEKFFSALADVRKLVALLAMPMGVGLYLIRTQFQDAVLGSGWLGIDPILGVFALSAALSWLIAPNVVALRSIGRPDLNAKLVFSSLLISLPIYLLSAAEGLAAFLIARLATIAFISLPLHFAIASKYLKINVRRYLREGGGIVASTTVMAAAVFYAGSLPVPASNSLSQLVLLLLVGVCIYTLGLALLERPFLKGLYRRYGGNF